MTFPTKRIQDRAFGCVAPFTACGGRGQRALHAPQIGDLGANVLEVREPYGVHLAAGMAASHQAEQVTDLVEREAELAAPADEHQTLEGSAVVNSVPAPGGDANLLRTGIVGSVIVALCCFTPVLVLVLGAVGLSAVMGWLDFMLLPALAVFLGITAYALWRRQHAA